MGGHEAARTTRILINKLGCQSKCKKDYYLNLQCVTMKRCVTEADFPPKMMR